MKRISWCLALGIMVSAGLLWAYIVSPIINNEGVVTDGSYRGIEIGYHRSTVIATVNAPTYKSKLKLISYRSADGATTGVFSHNCHDELNTAEAWYLSYPGIHQEIVTLVFDQDKVVEIRFVRELFAT